MGLPEPAVPAVFRPEERALIVYILALLMGAVAGLRTMTAPAAISWAAALGWLPLGATPLGFFGFRPTPYIFSVLAFIELCVDQLPRTPSRKVPLQFGARLISGGLCGGAIGGSNGEIITCLILGIAGAVIGTLGGAALRAWLARVLRRDLAAAILEDMIAIGAAMAIVGTFS